MLALAEVVRELVDVESPSEDVGAVRAAQTRLADLGTHLLGTSPDWYGEPDGPPSIGWHRGPSDDARRVLLLGHVDTVWPTGTLARRPCTAAGDRMRGPGVFDMKAGLAVALLAMRRLGDGFPVSLLVTGDEEVGSPASRQIVEEHARDAQACLVLEGAGPDGAVKSARKGWSFYTLTCTGVAAHAGLEPEEGVNALVGLAGAVLRVAQLDAPDRGLTVTPTMARSGSTVNTVPADGELVVDVRSTTAVQQDETDRQIRALTCLTPDGVRIDVSGGVNRPPMGPSASEVLVGRLRELTATRSWPTPRDVAVGGISDANLTAALGVPTLDGLGAVGGGAHAEHEWVDVPATESRIDLVEAFVADLVEHPLENHPARTQPPEGP